MILNVAGRPMEEGRYLVMLNEWLHQPRIVTTAATEIGQHIFELGLKVWLAATSELPTVSSPGRPKVPLEPGQAKEIMKLMLGSRLVRQQIAKFIEKTHKVPRSQVMKELYDMADTLGMFEEQEGATAPEGVEA